VESTLPQGCEPPELQVLPVRSEEGVLLISVLEDVEWAFPP
jgi:hypothetical protein